MVYKFKLHIILYMCGLQAGWPLEYPYLHPYLFKFMGDYSSPGPDP